VNTILNFSASINSLIRIGIMCLKITVLFRVSCLVSVRTFIIDPRIAN
jgi:hypothetical protein